MNFTFWKKQEYDWKELIVEALGKTSEGFHLIKALDGRVQRKLITGERFLLHAPELDEVENPFVMSCEHHERLDAEINEFYSHRPVEGAINPHDLGVPRALEAAAKDDPRLVQLMKEKVQEELQAHNNHMVGYAQLVAAAEESRASKDLSKLQNQLEALVATGHLDLRNSTIDQSRALVNYFIVEGVAKEYKKIEGRDHQRSVSFWPFQFRTFESAKDLYEDLRSFSTRNDFKAYVKDLRNQNKKGTAAPTQFENDQNKFIGEAARYSL